MQNSGSLRSDNKKNKAIFRKCNNKTLTNIYEYKLRDEKRYADIRNEGQV